MATHTDIEILQMFYKNNPSIPEISEKVGKSLGFVHGRIVELEKVGLITQQRKRNSARSRTLTKTGEEYLAVNGYIPRRVFDERSG